MPVAFYAVVSIGVIGLYWCFAVPIWHRWRMGDSFEGGSWSLGAKYKWLSVIALLDIVLVSLHGLPAQRRTWACRGSRASPGSS